MNHANHYKFDEGAGKVCYNTFIHPEAKAGKGGLVKIDKSVSVMYTQPAGAGPAKGPFCIGLGKLLWQNGPCAKYRLFSLRQSAEKPLSARKDMGQMENPGPKCLKERSKQLTEQTQTWYHLIEL